MEAVIKEMPTHWLEERRNSDASRWDEMWNGVLHMAPMPNRVHQRFVFSFQSLLQERWAKPIGGHVDQEVNLTTPEDEKNWKDNYRIPDLVLTTREQAHFDKNEYMAGPPLVCVEIRSPNDESYEKLPFYAELGVPEVWIIDRDSKKPEVFVLTGAAYESQASDVGGWIRSAAVGITLKAENQKLLVRFGNETKPEMVPN